MRDMRKISRYVRNFVALIGKWGRRAIIWRQIFHWKWLNNPKVAPNTKLMQNSVRAYCLTLLNDAACLQGIKFSNFSRILVAVYRYNVCLFWWWLMTTMSVVGECFFWYRLTRVVPDKIHRAAKRLCVCVVLVIFYLHNTVDVAVRIFPVINVECGIDYAVIHFVWFKLMQFHSCCHYHTVDSDGTILSIIDFPNLGITYNGGWCSATISRWNSYLKAFLRS